MNAASDRSGRGSERSAGEASRNSGHMPTALKPLDLVLFVILAVVLCARPLISETMERVAFSFLPAEAGGGPTPGTSVVLDFILLIAAVVVWIRNCGVLTKRRVWVGGYALLLAAIAVSVWAANDKRAAANAGSELFAIALAGSALAGLMSRRWMIHLLVAGVIAAGATNAVKCVTQNAWEFSDTFIDWQARKPQLIAAGFDPNSPIIVNFERRMQSTESFGYLSHPNVAASCIAMSLMCAGGVLLALLRARGADASRRIAAVLVAAAATIAMGAGIWLTGSLGAMVGVVAGAALLAAIGFMGRRLFSRARSIFLSLLCIYIAVIAIGTAYGLSKGTLPSASLAFRWEYWRAAAQGYRDAALTGVGCDNFRSVYLRHKSPESAEELSDPHDLWLSMLVELGPLGLLASLLLVGGVTYAGVAAGCPTDEPPAHNAANNSDQPPLWARRAAIVALVASVPLVQAAATGLPFGAPADVLPSVLLLWLVSLAGVWVAAATLCYSLVRQAAASSSGSRWIAAGLLAGMCATLVHNLIGFSMLTPAGLSMFAALAACAVAMRASVQPPSVPPNAHERGKGRFLAATACVALIAAHLIFVAAPTVRGDTAAERTARVFHASDAAALENAVAFEGELRGIDRWDSLSLTQLSQSALARAQTPDLSPPLRTGWLDLAERAVVEAIRRTPGSFGTARLHAEILDARAASADDATILKSAAQQWDIAVTLYPTDPRARIGAGLAWAQLWAQTRADNDAERAKDHLSAAIAIDATRAAGNASKLRRPELQVIEDTLAALGSG